MRTPKPLPAIPDPFATKRPFLLDIDLLPDPRKSPTQQRVLGLDQATVERYAECYATDVKMTPIKVFFEKTADGERYHYADGHHRTAGARRAKSAEIECLIAKGTQRDAILYALGCNADHGLQRTDADKRHCVETYLADPEWRTWNDQIIATRAHVGVGLVAKVRKQCGYQVDQIRRADGKVIAKKNAKAAKAAASGKQQSLSGPDINFGKVEEIFAQLQASANCRGMVPAKLMILAILGTMKPGQYISRHELQIGLASPLDVHPGQLRKHGLIAGDHAKGYIITAAGGELLEKAADEAGGATRRAKAKQQPKPQPEPEPNYPADTDGPEDVSLEETAPPAANSSTVETQAHKRDAPAKPLAERRLFRIHELLADRLDGRPEPRFIGGAVELMSLAVCIGVSTNPRMGIRWGDEMVAMSPILLSDRLRVDVADRLRHHDTEPLPPLTIIGTWWDIDVNALGVLAENAIPE